MPGTVTETLLWLRKQQRKRPYNFTATAKCKRVKAPEADAFGPNRSVVLTEGERIYLFETRRARDAFCRKLGARPAPTPEV